MVKKDEGGQIWLRLANHGQGWSRMVQDAQGWSRMLKIVHGRSNEDKVPSWFKFFKLSFGWQRMVKGGQRWLRMVKDAQGRAVFKYDSTVFQVCQIKSNQINIFTIIRYLTYLQFIFIINSFK